MATRPMPKLRVVAAGEMTMNVFRQHVRTRHGDAALSPDDHDDADHEDNFRILEHKHEREIGDAS